MKDSLQYVFSAETMWHLLPQSDVHFETMSFGINKYYFVKERYLGEGDWQTRKRKANILHKMISFCVLEL